MTEHGEQSRIEADEARVALAGARWRARSRRVKLYRRVLPIVILVLAGGALTWTVFRTVMSGVERKASQSQEVRLDAPYSTVRTHKAAPSPSARRAPCAIPIPASSN